MAGVDVGTAYLTVVPSAKGFAGKLQSELGGGMAAAGSKAGDVAGKSFGSRFKAGMVNAAKAGALGLAALLAGGVAFAKDAVGEARESQKVGALTAQVIKSTGGAAKISADQVGDLATALSNKTGIDDEVIQSGANMLLTFKNIRNEAGKGNDIFNQSTSILTDMATAMGTDPQKAAIQLGKALNDPVKGITALSRVGVTFTDGQKKTIESLVKGGKTAEAQKIILKELSSEFGGAAEASSTMGEKAAVSFGNLKEQIGTALLPYLDKAEKLLVDKVIPAISQFFQEMQDGTGKGGEFVDTVQKIGSALMDTGKFLLDHKKIIIGVAAAWVAFRIAAIAYNVVQLVSLALLKAHTVGTVENTVVTKAAAVASKLFAAGQWLVNAALSANPIGIVVIAIAALVAGIIIAYKKSETFRNIVKGAFEAISAAAKFMWNNVVAPVIRFLLDAFVKVTEFYATLLRGLSKIPGFGWAKGAADKLQTVADKAAGIKDAIHDIPDHKDVAVNFKVNGAGQVTLANGVKVDVGQFRARASGGPVAAGRPYIVGEREPELFVPKTSGTILNQSQIAAAGGGTVTLSRASIQALAAEMANVNLYPTLSVGSADRAIGGSLR